MIAQDHKTARCCAVSRASSLLRDGTYHHSASLAVRASVAAGVNVTYKLLRNSTVAMTGGQRPVGELSLPQIVNSLRAEGVAEVLITSDDPRSLRRLSRRLNVEVWHRNRLMEAQIRLSRVRPSAFTSLGATWEPRQSEATFAK